jgi:2-(1,2-epoxy-1,2-dihydrophenyl)acetyl-CoA isomerase
METLLVERDGGIVTVTLNRPEKKNAANDQMWLDLMAVFTEVADRAEDRVLVITGAGGAFCSGADLSSTDSLTRSGLARMRHIGSVALALHRLPKPTIAKVNGVAAGAGCNLALGCDLIVASDAARFSEIFAKRGLSLDFGGSWLLPRLVGMHKAKELALLADVIPASEAERLGIVNRVVPADELDAFVDDWARRLAAGPPLALSMSKTMLNNSLMVSMDQALEDEARSQSVNFSTKDFSEAIRAFMEKRDPDFQGN